MNPLDILKMKRQQLARLSNQQGAAGETHLIQEMDNWVARPKGKGLRVLLTALRETGIDIKASSFDAIELKQLTTLDFLDEQAVRTALGGMTFIEIKTANQPRVKADFTGFFFALTESEIAAAAALGTRHKVALRNNLTGAVKITSVADILREARSSSWQLSVQL